jgi:hypothetical protein
MNPSAHPEINERGTYMKLRTVLGCAHGEREKIASLDDLVRAVEDGRSPSFTYFRAHKRKGSELAPCSTELIRERVRLCAYLGLINSDTGQLTKLGTEAIRSDSFSRILTRQVRRFMEDKGFDFHSLHVLRRDGEDVSLPTAKTAYEGGHPQLSLPDFRRLLNVLVEAGYLQAVQSRIYLLHDRNAPLPRS